MKACFVLLFSLLSFTAFAADPSGTWKWKASVRGHEIESTLQLALKDGVLSGTIDNRAGKADIKEASFTNGQIHFVVEREFRSRKFKTVYEGHLDGDTITGTMTLKGGKDDQSAAADWKATRS